MAQKSRNPKVKGDVVWDREGIEISVLNLKAKRNGKNRIWIQIRPIDSPKWRTEKSLVYAYSADIRFVENNVGTGRGMKKSKE